RLYDVQLGFTNATPTGTNVVLRETSIGNTFMFAVPIASYSQFAIFGSSGGGNAALQITLNYISGAPTILTNVTFSDWFSGNPANTAASAAGTFFALTPTMSRQFAALSPNSGYEAVSGAHIYGINLAPDPMRALASVTVLVTGVQIPGLTTLNFF